MSLEVRHVARRRKARLSGLPTRNSVLKNALDVVMYPVAIVAPLALVPQAFKLYTTQDAAGYALSTWLVLSVVSLMWVWYGRVHREWPIIIAQTLFALLNFIIALGVLLYR